MAIIDVQTNADIQAMTMPDSVGTSHPRMGLRASNDSFFREADDELTDRGFLVTSA